MVAFSFIIQYYAMSLLMGNDYNNITNSRGKIYVSIIMALLMGLSEVIMHDSMKTIVSWNYYISFSIMLGILIYIYKKQIGINDKEYLKEMIEHHSMALLTSKEILNKTHNYKVKKLASNIVNTQKEEIKYMKQLLKEKIKN
jgi:hypothetical protein